MINLTYKIMLTGKVSTKGAFSLSGEISTGKGFSLSGDILCNTVGKGAEEYTGEYVVIPKIFEQSLNTTGYVMSRDVTVEKIPYSEVSNLYGGLTANIGDQ